MTNEIPKNVGRYRILRQLGAGAMGDVFLAEDPNIERLLAIKTVRLLGHADEVAERKQRLLREAKAAGRLLHPHAVALFDAGEADGTLYLAFELVDGPDLGQRLRDGPPPTLAEALRLVREVAAALDYAHRQGVVHRDIKPGNILIGPGGIAKVADFGIAKLTAQSTELTRTGSVVGSPQYMSPEQIRGEALDGRSDLFSLGAILYELLTGRRAFAAETLSTLVYQILSTEPEPLLERSPNAPQPLVALVDSLLAKDRNVRPATAGLVEAEVASLEASLPPELLAGPACRRDEDHQQTMPLPTPPSLPSAASAPVPPGAAPTAVPHPIPATPGDQPTRVASVVTPIAGPVPPPPPPVPPPTAPVAAGTTSSASSTGAVARRRPTGLILGLLATLVVLAIGAVWLRGVLAPPSRPDDLLPRTDRTATAPQAAEQAGITDGDEPAADVGEAESPVEAAEDEASGGDEPLRDELQDTLGDLEVALDDQTPTVEAPAEDDPAPPPALPPPPAAAQPAPPPPTTAPPQPRPEPTEDPPPASSTDDRALTRFDSESRGAQQHLETGLFLQFDVDPKETMVRYLRRGERRGILAGRVAEFESGKRDSRTLELPFEGEYLIALVPPTGPEYIVRTSARASRSGTTTIRANLANRSGGSTARMVEVSRAVAFNGEPTDAIVWVDGVARGPASKWPGGRQRATNLSLSPGDHLIRIVAPEHRPFEITVRVRPNAQRRQVIQYRLVRQP